MPRKWTKTRTILADLRSSVAQFKRDEDGNATYFAIFMFLMMLTVGGLSVDVMRNEMLRTQVQNTLDRAVLAAADLDQTLEPTAVVNDYFAKAGMSDYAISVTVDEGLNFRTVTATADASSKTHVMNILGYPELPARAVGTAEERVSNVEISMVLDISGSMGSDNKMENLQNAAGVFVDTVLKPETDDLISVSLIPYTAQVSAGEDIFNAMNITRWSGNPGWCVDFEATDFSTTTLRMDGSYEHMQFFDEGWNYNGDSRAVSNPGCPGRDDGYFNSDPEQKKRGYEQIIGFSQDATTLKNRINNYRARANTSIHIGMKWGVAMLDPSFRPVVQELGLDNKIDDAFGTRPALYSDPETLKTVLLMTDGQNVNTTRIDDYYYSWHNARVHWTKYPLHWYLNNYVNSNWNNWRYTKYTSAQADTFLNNICSAAKDKGIVVWSIGFEVTNYSAGVMRDCASSPSHFFRVEGIEITEAFEAIAKQINQLRLTQ
ncbi:pilus assembly protein TadG-related protein [Tateyamaria sp. SN6-1]|uniref:pilus assembly protein TadG-related protein n=1 Tax=Tateyamaria sp. SN6-1 TaxID=3092148 RepID=UPI0039F4AA6D